MNAEFDLIVIGAGSGGVRAARMAAATGARVALCEGGRVGGTCVNLGCIPKKLMVYASHVREECEDARGFGWKIEPGTFSWSELVRAKDAEITRLNGVYERLLHNSGVELIQGYARLKSASEVEVGQRVMSAERILLAVGNRPHVPDFPGAENVITSDDFFHLESLPSEALVLGGGYIAVELAGVLHGLGVKVTICHRGDGLLRGFDDDVRRFLADELRKKGIEIRFSDTVSSIEKTETGLRAHFNHSAALETGLVLSATGRVPRTESLGLDALGVTTSPRGAIVVDDNFQTSVPSIYALGDVIDRFQLTPVALAEAMDFVRIHFEKKTVSRDYDFIPTAVFSQPSVGTVGLSESAAKATCGEITVFQSDFRALKHTLSGRDERTFMKLIVEKESDRVVGCHMVGPEAGEIIQGFAVALRCGATKSQFDATIGIHPTAAEEFVTMRTPRG